MTQLPERFGPFVVLSLVGSGGMGEVYRARDPRLNRDVAIKILARTGADPARQRRFTDEAQAASALNHPNILTVYDVGMHDDMPYIVSELVEGTSVRALVGRAPLGLREMLDLSAQMADGLAAAHQAGIVHRDFKPENVMVTKEGRVKILDFGLAVIGTREGSTSAEADITMTQSGVIVGTVPYMSPEQARGATVDYRTDQFSLGLTMYEMVTGRRGFQAESAPQTLAAIIEDEPEPIGKLNPRVPAPLRWAIERCLAKDPRQRYESTVDLARELRTLRDRLTELAPSSDAATADVPIAALRRWGRWGRIAAVAGLAGIALSAAVAMGTRLGGGVDATLDRYRFTPFATDAGYQSSPAWSPDGKTMAYVAAVDGALQVFTKAIDSPLRNQVTHSQFDCETPFWSPDGTRLYYVSQARTRIGLWSISSVGGGEAELVMENVWRAAISPDGSTLALIRSGENEYGGIKTVWLSSPPGSEPVQYSRPPFDARKFFEAAIRFSPDGSKLGVWLSGAVLDSAPQGVRNVPEFWVLPTAPGAPRRLFSRRDLTNFAASFSWLPDSRHIVSAKPYPRPGVHLWITDTETMTERLITASGSVENDPSVSRDGSRVAMALQQANYDVYRIALDRPEPEPILVSARNEMDPTWSHSASQMAYSTDRSGSDEIWRRSRNGDFDLPIVTPRDFGDSQTFILSAPTFSPDGQRIAYYRDGPDGSGIWMSSVAGGQPVALAHGAFNQDLPHWSPDGGWIAYGQDSAASGSWSLVKMRVGAKTAPQVLVAHIGVLSPLRWSPDGAWVAFNGLNGLAVVPSGGGEPRTIYEEPWIAFDWSEDGTRLFGIRQSDDFRHLTLTSVDVKSGAERVVRADMMPMPVAAQPVRGFARMSATSFVTSIVRVSSDIWLLDGFSPPPGGLWARLRSAVTGESRENPANSR